mmetsp:Transcript_27818/g.74354  ORF Transcript_27818/g.74354 Transcript_27818/m.74354 type:complete len:217 (+) Transcript_27818:50-700(+)
MLLRSRLAMAASSRAHVIWLHGLGDSGEGWSYLEDELGPRFPGVSWEFPDAPDMPVSCNQGMEMPSWFDLRRIPVTLGEAHGGFEEAVAGVHALIQKAEDEGIPASRIVLGGFSQGGCLSLSSGLSSPRQLAGICCLSGWLSKTSAPLAQLATPVLMCHGTSDNKVPFKAGNESAEILQQAGCSKLRFKEYLGLPHGTSPQETKDVEAFLKEILAE